MNLDINIGRIETTDGENERQLSFSVPAEKAAELKSFLLGLGATIVPEEAEVDS
jgi:hypothetical protein